MGQYKDLFSRNSQNNYGYYKGLSVTQRDGKIEPHRWHSEPSKTLREFHEKNNFLDRNQYIRWNYLLSMQSSQGLLTTEYQTIWWISYGP